MRTWNIVALVLATAFAFSSVSYAQEEKKTLGEKATAAAETAGKVLEQGKAVYKGDKTLTQGALDLAAQEGNPTAVFWQSHQGFFQITFGKYWGGKVFLCAFIIIFILIATRKHGYILLIVGGLIVYFIVLRPVVFFTELNGSSSANIMGFIALGTLVVEIIICRKFFLTFLPTFKGKGFKETWIMDPDNPTTPDSGESPTDGDLEFSVCTNPSCGAKKVLNGKCRMCGHKVEATDAPDAAQPDAANSTSATGGSAAASAPVEAVRKPKTHDEKVDEAVDLLD